MKTLETIQGKKGFMESSNIVRWPFYPPKPAPCKTVPKDIKENWIAEPKKDGWRVIIVKDHGAVNAYLRKSLKDITSWEGIQYIIESVQKLDDDDFVVDGELCGENGRESIPSIKKGSPGYYYAFDLVRFETPSMPLIWRKHDLARICKAAESVTGGIASLKFLKFFSDMDYDALREYFDFIKLIGEEGIVIKRKASFYIASPYVTLVVPDWQSIK